MKNTIALIGLSTMLGLTVLMFVIFTAAYMSPAKAVRINVDNYGEAQFEFVLLLALLPLQLFTTAFLTRYLGKTKYPEVEEE
jgi:hypothetical protein